MLSNIMFYSQYIVYAMIVFGYMVLLNIIMNHRMKKIYDAEAEISRGLTSLALRRAGLQLGLGIAMLGVLSGKSHPDFTTDVIDTLSYGLLALFFILSSQFMTDKVILAKMDNNLEIKKGNEAVGIVEFSVAILTGTIAYASIYGDGGDWISSIIYFILGQATAALLVFAFEKITYKNNLIQGIANGELASAHYLAGKIIAFALILLSVIKGNGGTADIVTELISFSVTTVFAIVFLYVMELLIDWLILTKVDVDEALTANNVGVIHQLNGAKIGIVLVLALAIL